MRVHCKNLSLSFGSAEHVDDLGYFLSLIGFVPTRNGVLDAVSHMIAQDFFLGTPESCPDSRNLSHKINAVAILLDHARETSDLTFNTAEPLQHC